jgi:hypothetical protein
VGFMKTINGRRRSLWVSYEGPWNVTGKDINVTTTYRLGEPESPLLPVALLDFRTPFVDF